MPDFQPQFLQLFGHAGPTMALQAEAALFADMGQKNLIVTLALTHRATSPGAKSLRGDPHSLAEKSDRPYLLQSVDKGAVHPNPIKPLAVFGRWSQSAYRTDFRETAGRAQSHAGLRELVNAP